jgi:hypothetical protein
MTIEHKLSPETGVLIVRPKGPLSADDFAALSKDADGYIEAHGGLKGLMVCAPGFPGWEDLEGAISHFKFIRDHQAKIAKVALVSDSSLLSVAPAIARQFVSAEVRHFKGGEEAQALAWITG